MACIFGACLRLRGPEGTYLSLLHWGANPFWGRQICDEVWSDFWSDYLLSFLRPPFLWSSVWSDLWPNLGSCVQVGEGFGPAVFRMGRFGGRSGSAVFSMFGLARGSVRPFFCSVRCEDRFRRFFQCSEKSSVRVGGQKQGSVDL